MIPNGASTKKHHRAVLNHRFAFMEALLDRTPGTLFTDTVIYASFKLVKLANYSEAEYISRRR